MIIDKCKRCSNSDLNSIKDYEWLNEHDEIEKIDVEMCDKCKCIHWENATHSFFEFICKEKVEVNAAGGYATNYSIAASKSN